MLEECKSWALHKMVMSSTVWPSKYCKYKSDLTLRWKSNTRPSYLKRRTALLRSCGWGQMGNGCVNMCWRGGGGEGGRVKVLKRIKPTSRAYSAVTTHTHTNSLFTQCKNLVTVNWLFKIYLCYSFIPFPYSINHNRRCLLSYMMTLSSEIQIFCCMTK